METSLKKLALLKYSLAAPKIWVAQNLGVGLGGGGGEAAAPLAPPARTPLHRDMISP